MPKPYVRKMPPTWWLKRRSYFYFMLRELTAVFVAAYCVFLLVILWRIKQAGPSDNAKAEEFEKILDVLQTPWSIGLHFIALLFACYHAATWFNLTPQIMVVRLGEEKVPPLLIAASNYVIWIGVSVLLVWFVI